MIAHKMKKTLSFVALLDDSIRFCCPTPKQIFNSTLEIVLFILEVFYHAFWFVLQSEQTIQTIISLEFHLYNLFQIFLLFF